MVVLFFFAKYVFQAVFGAMSVQVIASLAYLVYMTDSFQQYRLRLAWQFESELSFYYLCGKARELGVGNRSLG